MRINNIEEIVKYINSNSIKNNRIDIVDATSGRQLIAVKEVIAVYTTEEDNWSSLNFEVLGNENSVCSIDINTIDSYDTENQVIRLGL